MVDLLYCASSCVYAVETVPSVSLYLPLPFSSPAFVSLRARIALRSLSSLSLTTSTYGEGEGRRGRGTEWSGQDNVSPTERSSLSINHPAPPAAHHALNVAGSGSAARWCLEVWRGQRAGAEEREDEPWTGGSQC